LAPTVTATSASTAVAAQTASVATRANGLAPTATASFADLAGTVHDGNITNAKLANDSVTIGSTEIDLGATANTLAGLTSISAITASFVLQTFESSSTIITSGSNILGDKATDIQQITGSLLQTGSIDVKGNISASVGGFSGSFQGDGSNLTGISSYAVANSANNRVITSVDSSNGNAEANLTFDGTKLGVTGNVSASAGFSGSFQGDGSELTGVGGFPHTGSADISGSLIVTGSAFVTSLTETSALRYKKYVKNIDDQANAVFQLRPVHFRWRDTNKKDYGLIAEEVQKIYPELVTNGEDGNALGISYTKLTALLLKTIQELNERIEILENKN